MPVKFEHRVGVSAPGDVVWAVLADLEHWREWNPLYVEAQGVIVHGGELVLTQKLGAQSEEIRPRVADWTPEDMLHWRRVLMRGWVKAIRYFEIEKLSNDASIFSNGELFLGRIAPFVMRGRRAELKAAFEAMGEALKGEAEKRWQAMPQSRAPKRAPPPKKKEQPKIALQPAPSRIVMPHLKAGQRGS